MSGAATTVTSLAEAPAGALPAYRPLGTFRLALALLVVLQHFQYLLAPRNRVFFADAGLGAIAVAIFFAVSGFVVTEAAATFYRARPFAFLTNRLLRVVPPYAAALALSALVQTLLQRHGALALWDYPPPANPADPRLLLSGLLSILPGLHGGTAGQPYEYIPFVWSLRLELAFYVAAAATIWAARRFAPAVPGALAACLALSAAFLTRLRPGVLSTAPMFLCGVSLALLLRRASHLRAAFALLSTLLAFAGFASWRQHGTPLLGAQLLAVALLLACFALLADTRLAPRFRDWDRRLGDLSYPLYLNHYVVGIAATSLIASRGLTLYMGGIAVSLALAGVMQVVVDRPLRHIRTVLRRARL